MRLAQPDTNPGAYAVDGRRCGRYVYYAAVLDGVVIGTRSSKRPYVCALARRLDPGVWITDSFHPSEQTARALLHKRERQRRVAPRQSVPVIVTPTRVTRGARVEEVV